VENNLFVPKILTDKARLQEIYDLRVVAWENSPLQKFVNREYFPNGWKDGLDERAIHWIVETEGKIIASARICLINNTNEIEDNVEHVYFEGSPLAYFSRFVVHPDYRGKGISYIMDGARVNYVWANRIPLSVVYVDESRFSALQKFGFKCIAEVSQQYGDNTEIDTLFNLTLKIEDIIIAPNT
jgi:GNAT superfamily N-acetyltransferase